MAKTKYKEEDSVKRPMPVARDGAYVMMLFVALVAIIGGCVMMYLDHEEYGGKTAPSEKNIPAIQKLGDASKAGDLPAVTATPAAGAGGAAAPAGGAAAPAGGAAPAPAGGGAAPPAGGAAPMPMGP